MAGVDAVRPVSRDRRLAESILAHLADENGPTAETGHRHGLIGTLAPCCI